MAKPGDKPKQMKAAESKTEEIKVVEVKDTYGFGKTIEKLSKKGYSARNKSGVIMVEISKDEKSKLDSYVEKVRKIIEECKFPGSWGVCVSRA